MEGLLGCELHEFLNHADCWDKIIEISETVWEKDMPDQFIKKLFLDYDRNKELNKEERKFNESFDLISQHSMKNPLSESEDELDERMNVELDTEH